MTQDTGLIGEVPVETPEGMGPDRDGLLGSNDPIHWGLEALTGSQDEESGWFLTSPDRSRAPDCSSETQRDLIGSRLRLDGVHGRTRRGSGPVLPSSQTVPEIVPGHPQQAGGGGDVAVGLGE